jgi:ATP-dependent protease ClpP protease subunit
MQSIINEYLEKKLNILSLQDELQRLIKEYNKHTNRYLFVYAADVSKGTIQGVVVTLVQDDFYTIQDLLRESTSQVIDVYLETPGGSGEAAEEIAKFLRRKFTEVNFVIAGEAKSAGTILALSGDNIYMVDTGSLGPIDAQVKIGRYVGSAHDYKEWIENKKKEALATKSLNPVDALIIAQISPLEIAGVINSLEFAKDLVKEWLEKYKFKKWTITETKKNAVTDEMRKARANDIAEKLCNHTVWRTHGRSLKMSDLKDDLLIENIDNDSKLANIVYSIKVVVRLIFDSSTIYKLYFSEDLRLSKTFTPQQSGVLLPIGMMPQFPTTQPQPAKASGAIVIPPNTVLNNVKIDVKCPKCGKHHEIMGYFDLNSKEIAKKGLPLNPNVKDNDMFVCDNCNFVIDLKPVKAGVELQANKKITFK